ncbi:patatin-like phospholipase family protein [Bradyrhizobium sp.]|jgi:predicted patatin/cPLA2 family phospholipase|uniref:patatin-like phospholipase family protein n=1 Tax=Bradyrhizobium sp. TaxID=376 RepID=UPI002DDD803B|nr:patatin-like phospholipase family protein [Bradyrhizobium sp.]HEV2158308.1 patatin-like phospholipase family protein [Bradyrhizobium sp.]
MRTAQSITKRDKRDHLDPHRGPKRILSLDGGGVRGVLSLEYLERIEALLRARHHDPDLRLGEYFDLIGGTSTGAIIAAGLACGMTAASIKVLYRSLATTIFQKSRFLPKRGLLAPKFSADRVQSALDAVLGADITLSSERILTGLMIMTKRLDTGSLWPLNNHPSAPYAAQTGQMKLTQIVRASTAAPTYFEPERLCIASRSGTHVDGAFVDGGVSPFNDPALQMLLIATLHGHAFRWPAASDKILLISIGTGTYRPTYSADEIMNMLSAMQGVRALQSLMDDCARSNQTVLQWLTRTVTPWSIDRVVGSMEADSSDGPQLATYARYDALIDASWLKSTLGLTLDPETLAQVARMDNASNMDRLAEIGNKAAKLQVQPEHFPQTFDMI